MVGLYYARSNLVSKPNILHPLKLLNRAYRIRKCDPPLT